MRFDVKRAFGAGIVGAATAVMLVLGGCAAGAMSSGAPASAPMAATAPTAEYKLGNGDEVRLIVYGEAELSGTFTVDGSGNLAIPLIGNMLVAGKSLREFETELAAKLKEGYMTEPRVSAEVTNFRPFYILGEVNQSGTYPFTSGLTVPNAVATARGFTYRADQRRVFIKRQGENKEVEVPMTTTTPVLPGDTIRVPERFF